MSKSANGHLVQCEHDLIIKIQALRVRSHDIDNRGFSGGKSLSHHTREDVTFAEQSDQLVVVDNQNHTLSILNHHVHGVSDSGRAIKSEDRIV